MREPTYILVILWISYTLKSWVFFLFRGINVFLFQNVKNVGDDILVIVTGIGTMFWLLIGIFLNVFFEIKYAEMLVFIPTIILITRILIRSYNGWKVMHDLGDA